MSPFVKARLLEQLAMPRIRHLTGENFDHVDARLLQDAATEIQRFENALSRIYDWREDENGIWFTGCGNAHEFTWDGPSENMHDFCPYCGGRLAEIKFQVPNANSTTFVGITRSAQST